MKGEACPTCGRLPVEYADYLSVLEECEEAKRIFRDTLTSLVKALERKPQE